MNPIVMHYQAQARMDELQREAEWSRRAAASGTRPTANPLRAAMGHWLIAVGERLAPAPAIDTIGYRR